MYSYTHSLHSLGWRIKRKIIVARDIEGLCHAVLVQLNPSNRFTKETKPSVLICCVRIKSAFLKNHEDMSELRAVFFLNLVAINGCLVLDG